MRSFQLSSLALGIAALAGCGGSSGGKDDPVATVPALTMQITATEDFPGSYGAVGAYEKVSGTLHGELDPRDPKNAIIQDLSLAPVNVRGMVEYATDFVLLKPRDMTKASGILRYDAPNRGNILTMPNPSASPGDAIVCVRLSHLYAEQLFEQYRVHVNNRAHDAQRFSIPSIFGAAHAPNLYAAIQGRTDRRMPAARRIDCRHGA